MSVNEEGEAVKCLTWEELIMVLMSLVEVV